MLIMNISQMYPNETVMEIALCQPGLDVCICHCFFCQTDLDNGTTAALSIN